MKEYFTLQYTMLNRKLDEIGIHPILALVLAVTGFILIGEYLYFKSEFATYLVLLTSLSILFNLSEKNRNEFLTITFGDKTTREIRIIENLNICLPFVVLLLFHNSIWESIVLLIAAIVIATVSLRSQLNFTIPTPFSKDPFEFPVGFRKTFYVFPIAYALTIIAISVDNINLGIFAMALVFLVSLSYYAKPENIYYIWIHTDNPNQFLFRKLMTATKYVLLLALPIVIGLAAFYPMKTGIILLFCLAGLLFLWTIILAKYSAYPREINLPQGIFIALSLYLPPLLLILIPFFYKKSIAKLNAYLL